jgi:hypothetical protein
MPATPPDNYIAWTVAPATNTLRFEHVGCVVGDGTWTHPLDDIHLPLTEQRTHCECCGLEKRLRRGNGSAEIFRLDRSLLREYLITDGETDSDDDTDPEGISSHSHSTLPTAIASYFSQAIDADAVVGVADVEVVVYECAGDALIITVRELTPPTGVPWRAQRQIASMSIEAHDIGEYGDETFAAACETLDEILRIASRLVPSLRALQLLEANHETVARGLRSNHALPDPALANLVVAAGGALVRREP